jgi:membrane-bound lytic murein transglycosylase A
MPRRTTLIVALALIALAFATLWRLLHLEEPGRGTFGAREPEERLVLRPASFPDLPGWGADDPSPALAAFLRSCRRLLGRPPGEPLGIAGTAGDWQPVCAAAARVPDGAEAARAYFEERFQPFAASSGDDPEGLFTGYYEPLLHGSRKRSGRYRVPLYVRPPELVTVDLGAFRAELEGQRLAGRVEDGALVPYPDRRAIAEGALAGRDLELVWVDDPIDAFFLEIQGSGRIRFEDGKEMRVGYAAQNGHPYFAIGKDLVERKALKKEEVSMQSIRRWLEEHPDEADDVMERNASYVFFQKLKGEGPLGAQGVPLTPGRSLAVDLAHWPLGVPIWLDARAPSPRPGEPDQPLRRLLVAQDTGGAIRGPIRGDVFWGHGEEAAEVAGRMKHPGRMWVLLPRHPQVRRVTPEAGAGFPSRPARGAGASRPHAGPPVQASSRRSTNQWKPSPRSGILRRVTCIGRPSHCPSSTRTSGSGSAKEKRPRQAGPFPSRIVLARGSRSRA